MGKDFDKFTFSLTKCLFLQRKSWTWTWRLWIRLQRWIRRRIRWVNQPTHQFNTCSGTTNYYVTCDIILTSCVFVVSGDEGEYDEYEEDGKEAEAAAQPYSPGVGYPQQVGYQPPPLNYNAPPPDYNGVTSQQNPNSSIQFNDPNLSRSSAADTFV